MTPLVQPSITHCSPCDCPLGTRWHANWRAYTLATTRTPEDRAVRDRVRAALNGLRVCLITPHWAVGPGDASLFDGHRTPPLTSASHTHAAFVVADHEVHIDHINATGGGPGFSLGAVVIHVDGVFRGSGWVFGSLGGGGNSFPALARIDEMLAVAVDHRSRLYTRAPYVELRRATPSDGDSK